MPIHRIQLLFSSINTNETDKSLNSRPSAFTGCYSCVWQLVSNNYLKRFYTLSKWLWSLIHAKKKLFNFFFCSSAICSFCSSVKLDIVKWYIVSNLSEFISKVLFTRKIVSINYFVVQQQSGEQEKMRAKIS